MSRHLVALGAVAMLSACSTEEPTPDWSWRGEHVVIHAYDYTEDEVCGGTFEATDAHVGQIAAWYGVDASGFEIPVHWVAPTRFRDELWCPSYAAACTDAGEVKVSRLPYGHELSHAVDYASGLGRYAPVLEEGLAAIHSDPEHGGPHTPSDPVDPETDLPGDIRDALVTPPEAPDDWFSVLTAGHFVTYLIETYGFEAILQLQVRTSEDIGEAGWDAVFQELVGQSFDEVLAGYEAFPLCSWNQYRSKLWECSGDADFTITPDMEPVTFSVDLSCDNPRAVGNSSRDLRVAHRLHVPGPDEGIYRIDVRRPGALKLEFGVMMVEECGVPCSEGPRVWAPPGDIDEVEYVGWRLLAYGLRSGTYALVFSGTGNYEVTIAPGF